MLVARRSSLLLGNRDILQATTGLLVCLQPPVFDMANGDGSLRDSLQVSIVVGAFTVAFLLGYNISVQSGNEPGYFEATEAGAYGVVEKLAEPSGLSAEDSDYYKSLLNE